MKTIIMLLAGMLLFTGYGYAQDTTARHRQNDGQHMQNKMRSEQRMNWSDYKNPPLSHLNLTASQRMRMDSVNRQFTNERKTLRADKSVTSQDRMSRMREIQKNEEAQMQAILTPAQKEKLSAWRKDNMQTMHKNDHARNMAPRKDSIH